MGGGSTLEVLKDSATNLNFAPESAVVTGTSFWTVYDVTNGCRNIASGDELGGKPRFYTNLREELDFSLDIKDVKIGCHCDTDPYTPCA